MDERARVLPREYVCNTPSRSYAAVASAPRSATDQYPSLKSRIHLNTVSRGDDQVHDSKTQIICANPRGLRLPVELLDMLVNHLCYDSKSLSRLLRVCKEWFKLLNAHLWMHGDPMYMQASLVRSPSRRMLYAASIRSVQFYSHEEFWTGLNSSRPDFSNIKSLELYDTALHMSPGQDLIPFLSAPLKRLAIYSTEGCAADQPEQGADTLWLSHVARVCKSLEEVYLDAELAVSHELLAEFFAEGHRMEKVTLSELVTPALTSTFIEIIFSLPRLEDLHLDHLFTLADVTQIKGALPILPSIRELTITFSEGAGLAPRILLDGLHTLKHLDISLGNSTTNWFYDISTSLFKTIGSLQNLTDLIVKVYPGLHITDAELSALANLKNLRCLDISEMPVNCLRTVWPRPSLEKRITNHSRTTSEGAVGATQAWVVPH